MDGDKVCVKDDGRLVGGKELILGKEGKASIVVL
jgi:hypothetical protein